ncbi:MAG: hypothetical protein JKX94_03855 [Sneathiella sp.]|nr:hypothetical protein [Sneathiella sp.]
MTILDLNPASHFANTGDRIKELMSELGIPEDTEMNFNQRVDGSFAEGKFVGTLVDTAGEPIGDNEGLTLPVTR